MSTNTKVKTLAKGESVQYLDYIIKNSVNNDGLVLLKPFGKLYETHLGNYGPGEEQNVLHCKRAALIYFMLARPETFATNIYYHVRGYGGQMHEYYLLRNKLQEEGIEMPEEITCSMDMNAQILFNNKLLNKK